jgi:hypothetical protein
VLLRATVRGGGFAQQATGDQKKQHVVVGALEGREGGREILTR